jgi:hypothetical protein
MPPILTTTVYKSCGFRGNDRYICIGWAGGKQWSEGFIGQEKRSTGRQKRSTGRQKRSTGRQKRSTGREKQYLMKRKGNARQRIQ